MRSRWISGVVTLCVTCLTAYPAFATDVADSKAEALAASSSWKALLHVRLHPFTLRTMSQNDSADFFLAADGKQNPASELKADLAAFLQTGMAPDASAQCRFPARYFWLKQQLPELNFTDQSCPAFNDWRQELDARAITLIFPASHINSPSSMYGHTLIRLDRADEQRSKLLAYAVNFAANADPADNELKFSYKGLTGGYPGVVSVMPYYVKTNEYQHMEYRDVWEYRLNLTPAEVDQFVRHIWEVKDTYFDYFFFDENCSYRIIALLDASSQRLNLADDFLYKAVPVDTIRALEQAGVVERVDYRPSAASELEYKSTQVSSKVLEAAKALVETDTDIAALIDGLNAQDQVRALELAHAYARYLSIKKKEGNPDLRKRTLAILSARSKIQQDARFDDVPLPKWRDDQGHLTQRLGLRTGVVAEGGQTAFTDLRLRMAYHDVQDLPVGFVPGSQIQMGQFDLRFWQDGDVRLQKAMIVDVLSLSHQTEFQRPVAWAVSFGADRFAAEDSELFGFLHVAFGKAWLAGSGRYYALGELQLLADNQFRDGYQASAGPRLGWLWQGESFQGQFEANWQGLSAGDDTERTTLRANAGWRLADDLQLRLGAERQLFHADGAGYGVTQLDATLNWYF
ncbi:DUF4105 domain-containing protein [Thalassolituus sp. LLYu03]|uniref:Lnb N-terminal periplasmic domain-containing protein n=1 Tax=Thalassolituus sp. LLYu03 TaxID=3421656 RepID=UPI003D2C1C35